MEYSSLESWGFGPFFFQAFSSLARPDLVPARVTSEFGARLEVVSPSRTALLARPSGRLRHVLRPAQLPTVGDWVAISAPEAGEDPAVIHHVLPRHTQLSRRAVDRDQDQIVAVNVDTFFVVTSANQDASARRIERYLTAVWDSGAAPVVIVNKIDLVPAGELADLLAELAAAAPGVPVAPISASTGAGVAGLAAYFQPGRTVALIGSSGVGKSSLINRWLGRGHQAILPIDHNDRGRHATSRRELFALPGGGLIVDTPGMRQFALLDTETGLDDTFADIARLAAHCRFRDCRHGGEPGCAIEAAIDAGQLDPHRMQGLHKLERELAAAEHRRQLALARTRHQTRRELALARDDRERSKAANKALRARAKIDPKLRK